MRPAAVKLYTNTPHGLDFSDADDTEPTQELEIPTTAWDAATGTASLPLRFVRFQHITSLVVYVTRGEGGGDGDGDGNVVRLDRVRLVGETGEKRTGKIEKIEMDE